MEVRNNKAFGPVCFRCDRSIEPGEKMFTIYISLAKFKSDFSFDCIDERPLSQFCFGCASMILTEAAITERLVTPMTFFQEIDERGIK